MEGLEAIRAAFPGQPVKLEGEGQLTWAFRIGPDLVARVPRHRYGIDRLAFEVDLLETIRPLLSVRVPEIVEVALDLPPGQAHVVHRRIPGQVLSPESVGDLRAERLERIGRQVGTFLRELHEIDLDKVPAVPRLTPSTFADQLRAELDALPAGLVPSEALPTLYRDLEGLAVLPTSPAVLCHTDIGGNIVVSESDDEVGIIDFGSCFVSHPALDLASLSVVGEELTRAATKEYSRLGQLRDEAEAVRRTFVLQDALYGARQEDWSYARGIFHGTR